MEAQAEDREIISIGDINLNSLTWDIEVSQKSKYEEKHKTHNVLGIKKQHS